MLYADVQFGSYGPVMADLIGFNDDQYVKDGTWAMGDGYRGFKNFLGFGTEEGGIIYEQDGGVRAASIPLDSSLLLPLLLSFK